MTFWVSLYLPSFFPLWKSYEHVTSPLKVVGAAKRELDALRSDQMELAGLEKDMEKYRGAGYDAQLEEHKNKVASVNRAIAEKEREKARVEGERSELEAAVNNHDKIMWQLNDLLSLRAKRRDAKALEAEVARCDGQLKELDYDKERYLYDVPRNYYTLALALFIEIQGDPVCLGPRLS